MVCWINQGCQKASSLLPLLLHGTQGEDRVEHAKLFFTEQVCRPCTGCDICIDERCSGKAIAAVEEGRCIWRGLCVTGCTSGVMELVRRKLTVKTPKSMIELSMKV